MIGTWKHQVCTTFFSDYINKNTIMNKPGIVEMLTNLKSNKNIKKAGRLNWAKYITNLQLKNKNFQMHLISAGKMDNSYYKNVRDIDFDVLYAEYNGGEAIENLREEWKERYDFILLDSRTGITDIGGVCTIQLPDILVILFTATKQSLDGVVDVAKRASDAQKELMSDRLRLITIPIPSRFDSKEEFKISQEWNKKFANALIPIYKNWLPTSVEIKDMIEVTKIPYSTYFSFGEKLAVVEQSRKDSGGLSYSYENIAALLANEIDNVELLVDDRDRYVLKASSAKKRKDIDGNRIFISYSHKDQEIFERLMVHLKALERFENFTIWTDMKIEPGHNWYSEMKKEIRKANIVILLISADYISSDFIMRDEFSNIFEREIGSDLKIIPIIVKPCFWKKIPFIRVHQVFPQDGKPLMNHDKNEVEELLYKLTESITNFSDVNTNDNFPQYISLEITGERVPSNDGGLIPKGKKFQIHISSKSLIEEVASIGRIPINRYGEEWFILNPIKNRRLSHEECSNIRDYFNNERVRNLEIVGLSPE